MPAGDSTADQLAMLAYAERWVPYGGGFAEDIVVEFGITHREYFSRLLELVLAGGSGLDPALTQRTIDVCRRRLREPNQPFYFQ